MLLLVDGPNFRPRFVSKTAQIEKEQKRRFLPNIFIRGEDEFAEKRYL